MSFWVFIKHIVKALLILGIDGWVKGLEKECVFIVHPGKTGYFLVT